MKNGTCFSYTTMEQLVKEEKTYFRYSVRYEFESGRTLGEAVQNLRKVFGDKFSENTCRRWYKRFNHGNMSVNDNERSGRPKAQEYTVYERLIGENKRLTLKELALMTSTHYSTASRAMKKMGKVWKYGVWIPHELTTEMMEVRTRVCNSLLGRNSISPILNSIVTGDEKWVLYVNPKRRRQWVNRGEQGDPDPKPSLHPKKIMLCVWWCSKGIVHYEFLPSRQTVTAEVYCSQLQRVKDSLAEKFPEFGQVLFLHDNARPHVARLTQQKLVDLGWEILPHPPYSPDLAPTDYHLFRSLQNFLGGQSFENLEHIENAVLTFFRNKEASFYERGIEHLVERWEHVAENGGSYYGN